MGFIVVSFVSVVVGLIVISIILSNELPMKRVGKQQDVKQLGAGAGPRTLRRSRSRRASVRRTVARRVLGDLQPEQISLP